MRILINILTLLCIAFAAIFLFFAVYPGASIEFASNPSFTSSHWMIERGSLCYGNDCHATGYVHMAVPAATFAAFPVIQLILWFKKPATNRAFPILPPH